MNDRQVLYGKALRLEPLSHHHIERYLMSFSERVREALKVHYLESERDYLESSLASDQVKFFYCIIDLHTDQLIGAIAIRDRFHYPGQLYSWIHESYWGSGLYAQALLLLMSHYFHRTNDRYITAQVDVDNSRSYKALKKIGFADCGYSIGMHGKQFELIVRNSEYRKQ